MNRIISFEEAKKRLGDKINDSTAFTVKELMKFIDKTEADNLRIYFYKDESSERTNFLISAYKRGVENQEVFFGDVVVWNPMYIIIEEQDSVLNVK